jgi:polyhydroxybutyrate depolymerase
MVSGPTVMKAPLLVISAILLPVLGLTSGADEPLKRQEFSVDGVMREALVYAPPQAAKKPMPVVFAFHGHGGTMIGSAKTYGYHALWPEAMVLYPQGLNTPGKLTDPEGKKPGWQSEMGEQGDRDLKFFDAMLADVRAKFKVDDKRIYATGHSNGGGFTYLLWAARGEKFAAFAPSAAAAFPCLPLLKPKPVLHVAGENDPLVKFVWQEKMIEGVRKINECVDGQAWERDPNCTIYPSKLSMPVVTAIHGGDHRFPPKAPAAIVKFFKDYPPGG